METSLIGLQDVRTAVETGKHEEVKQWLKEKRVSPRDVFLALSIRNPPLELLEEAFNHGLDMYEPQEVDHIFTKGQPLFEQIFFEYFFQRNLKYLKCF